MQPDARLTADRSGRPVRVGMAPDAALIIAGTTALIAQADAGVEVVALQSNPVAPRAVDLCLYDPETHDPAVLRTLRSPSGSPVKLVAFSWSLQSETVARARVQGAAGLLSKHLSADELAAALRAVHDARPGPFVHAPRDQQPPPRAAAEAPAHDLTARELEVLELITQGLMNEDIARQLYVSINTVKTYIRGAYRKIGVTRRPQAVLWGVHHGFRPGP